MSPSLLTTRFITRLLSLALVASVAACTPAGNPDTNAGAGGGMPEPEPEPDVAPAGCQSDADCADGELCDRGQALTARVGQSTHAQSAECVAGCVPECEAAGEADCEDQCGAICEAIEDCIDDCAFDCEDDACAHACVDACWAEVVGEPGGAGGEPGGAGGEPGGAGGEPGGAGGADDTPSPAAGTCRPAPEQIDWADTWTLDLTYTVVCELGFGNTREGEQRHTETLVVRSTGDGFEATVEGYTLTGTGNASRLILSGTFPIRDDDGNVASDVDRTNNVTLRLDEVIDPNTARGTIEGTYEGRFGEDCSTSEGVAELSR